VPVRGVGAVAGLLLTLLCAGESASGQVVVTQGTDLSVDVSRSNGQLAIDLVGGIWLLPPRGGAAVQLPNTSQPARRPRWSPDGSQILYHSSETGTSKLWLIDIASGENSRLGLDASHYQHAAWHPGGGRIVFSSQRRSSGMDLWEMDLQTGVEWRLSSAPGDETQAAWSADGRHLVYVHRQDDRWTLVMRRYGMPEIDVVVSDTPLAAPSWRPDGTLITFLQKIQDNYALQMLILSEPPMEMQLGAGEDYLLAPVSWPDREAFFYTSEGLIKKRGFGERRGRTVQRLAQRDLPLLTPPSGKLVIRSTRLFDGISRSYRNDLDVLIDGGIIESVVPRQDWPNLTVLDVGNTTLLPGFIDAYSALPEGPQALTGPEMLSYGVTTLVSNYESGVEPGLWEGEQYPGPRLLPAASLGDVVPEGAASPIYLVAITAAERQGQDSQERVHNWQEQGIPVFAENWITGRSIGASLLLVADSMPASPTGNRYQDKRVANTAKPVAWISGMADAETPGLEALFNSRQAVRHKKYDKTPRRLASLPNLSAEPTPIVLGSQPNGLPPGLSLHAELRALSASGLRADQVFKTTTQNAARILGLEGKIGQIIPGARADLVLVTGDPLKNVADALNIVAVVRNGRFFSLVSLLERSQAAETVE